MAAMKSFFVWAAVLGAVVAVAGQPAETPRRVLFSATDQKGAPVADLGPADLTVKEGGQARPIATLAPATGRVHVSILVDDGGSGMFQGPVSHFLNQTAGRADVAISILNPQAIKLVDFTSDPPALQGAVAQLRQRGRLQPDWMQVVEGVSWAARDLRANKAQRPVILVLTSGGEPGYIEQVDAILTDVKASGASLHVVYVSGVDLGKVLGEGSTFSGGTQSNAASTKDMSDALSRIATVLRSQYELTYLLPAGARPSDRLQIQTTRKGLKLIAPQRIPDR